MTDGTTRADVTISDLIAGRSPKAARRVLARMAKAAKGEARPRYLSEIQALRELRNRLRVRYCSEPRLELATDARCEPLPGVACQCDQCRKVRREWPGVYLMAAKQRGEAARVISYECWLESQDEFFLHALPSSSSIVRFG